MLKKIKWYQEVLEVEPGSKVFFPLAGLLQESGQLQEAADALQRGLEKHPEHIEARLLYVEVLRKLGRGADLRASMGALTEKMAHYPQFWRAWAEYLDEAGESRDCVIALNFLAAHFQGQSISWAEVIERGLESLTQGSDSETADRDEAASVVPVRASREKVMQLAAVNFESSREPEPPAEISLDPDDELDAVEDAAPAAAPELRIAGDRDVIEDAAPKASSMVSSLPAPSGEEPLGEDLEADETISLRTKTMADLLAEQGDYDGALDIYRELMAAAPEGALREEYDGLIEKMQLMARDKYAADRDPRHRKKDAKPLAKALNGKKKLMDTLESLVQRLEARAAV